MIMAELKKTLFCTEMIISIIIMFVCHICGAWNYLIDYLKGRYTPTLLNMFMTSIYSGIITIILPIICILPIVNGLINENASGYGGIIMIRTGRKRYVTAKIISSVVSGIYSVFFSSVLYVLFLYVVGFRIVLPNEKMADKGLFDGSVYWTLIEKNLPWLCLLLIIVIFSMTTISWSVIAFMASMYTKNKYILIVIPFLIEKLLIFVCYPFNELYYVNPLTWQIFSGTMMNSSCGGLIYEIIVQGIFILVGSVAISLNYRRRYRYA